MNAVIYAAGKGVRLGVDHPKILLEFGGRSLLEWHLRHLTAIGVTRVLIVTGFQREAIAAMLQSLGQHYGIEVEEVVNHEFNEGSVLSFNVSLPYLKTASEPILLMDGDVLYPAAILQRLSESIHPTALLLDRDYSTADDDPVLVPVKGGRPIDFRKKWAGDAELVGESVGFFKVAPDDIPLLVAETTRRAAGTGAERAESYDDVLRALVVAGRFGYEDVTGLPWIEIDFPQDIERARREVLPLIESSP